MSGSVDHPSDSRGWNHEWFGASPFPSLDTNFSPPLHTKCSQILGGYRPYPVDEQDVPSWQYGWTPEQGSRGNTSTPPLSKNPEGASGSRGAPAHGVRVRTRGSTSDPNVRTPYTLGEIEKIFEVYLKISEDGEVSTNQTEDRFWLHVARWCNADRPTATVECNESMVRNVIGRVNEEIQKFQGYYLEEQQSTGSGMSEVDIITDAMSIYQSMD